MAASDEALSAVVQDQIAVTRLEASEMRRVRRILTDLEGELVAKIARIDPTGPAANTHRTKRLKKLLDETRALIAEVYTDINKTTRETRARLAVQQSRSLVKRTNTRIGVDILRATLPAREAARISREVLIQGAVSRDWWNSQSVALQKRFEQEMQKGLVANEDISQLSARVRGTRENAFTDGIMAVTKSQAESLVRTSLAATANESRVATYKENSDVVKGIQWQAVLDTRTTIICQTLDGLVWDLDFNPIGHSQSYPGPTAHWGERSTQVPVLKSFEELSGKGGNKALARELDRRLSEVEKRASFNGEVAGKETYESWLRKQPKSVQVEALGPARRELWLEEGLSFTEMITQQNRPLSIEQLEEKV